MVKQLLWTMIATPPIELLQMVFLATIWGYVPGHVCIPGVNEIILVYSKNLSVRTCHGIFGCEKKENSKLKTNTLTRWWVWKVSRICGKCF